jgi:hypothetical protein
MAHGTRTISWRTERGPALAAFARAFAAVALAALARLWPIALSGVATECSHDGALTIM